MLPEQEPQDTQEPQRLQQAVPAPQRSNTKWIPWVIGGGCVLLLCAGVAVVVVGALLFFQPVAGNVFQQVQATMEVAIPVQPGATSIPTPHVAAQQPRNSMGDPNAPVKIIEYADFQCPYCMQFHQDTEPQIIAQYVKTGKVYFEYHSVGAFLGEESGAAAQAAYCAGDQGKFWEYHDTLFSHWTGENVGDFTNDKLQQYAAALGLDETAFNGCLSTGKYASLVQQDVTDARAAGIKATPSFLVNGKLVEGALPFSDFQQAIEAALKGQ